MGGSSGGGGMEGMSSIMGMMGGGGKGGSGGSGGGNGKKNTASMMGGAFEVPDMAAYISDTSNRAGNAQSKVGDIYERSGNLGQTGGASKSQGTYGDSLGQVADLASTLKNLFNGSSEDESQWGRQGLNNPTGKQQPSLDNPMGSNGPNLGNYGKQSKASDLNIDWSRFDKGE